MKPKYEPGYDRHPHPTTHQKDIQSGRLFHERKTRPLTINVANQMMEACFSLLAATKNWPEIDMGSLAVARKKAQDAFKSWRRAHGGPGSGSHQKYPPKHPKERKHARREQQPAPVDDPNPGSQPGDASGEGR